MSSSSTHAVYNGTNEGKEAQSATYNLDRFLGRNGHVDEQRPLPGFTQMRDQAGAETDAEARMRAQIDAFNVQFSSSNN